MTNIEDLRQRARRRLRAIDVVGNEIDVDLVLLGCVSARQLDASALAWM